MQYVEVIAGALLALVGGKLALEAHRSLSLYRSAMSWPVVPGVVVRSELSESTDGDGTSYQAEITCSYSAAGHVYTTSRHTGGVRFSQPEQAARALLSAFPVGTAVEIGVHPSDAAVGVLLDGKPEHMIVIRRIGLAALVAGVCLGLYGVFRGG